LEPGEVYKTHQGDLSGCLLDDSICNNIRFRKMNAMEEVIEAENKKSIKYLEK